MSPSLSSPAAFGRTLKNSRGRTRFLRSSPSCYASEEEEEQPDSALVGHLTPLRFHRFRNDGGHDNHTVVDGCGGGFGTKNSDLPTPDVSVTILPCLLLSSLSSFSIGHCCIFAVTTLTTHVGTGDPLRYKAQKAHASIICSQP